MRFLKSPILRSLFLHGVLAGLMLFHISHDEAQVRGGAGLAGRTQTHFDMTVSQPEEAPPEEQKAPPPPVREGLPTEVKNETPREIESSGHSEGAPVGTPGQAGSGDTAATEIGNSDRSNTEGIYLLKLQQKIQENLEAVGYIDFDRKTLLQFLVRKSGAIEEIRVIRSSGDQGLDRKAIQAVQKVQTFLERPNDLQVQVPVLFRATR